MRVPGIAIGMLAAALLLPGAAQAGAGKFSLCTAETVDRNTAAGAIFAAWPELRPRTLARDKGPSDGEAQALFVSIAAYPQNPDTSARGALYEMFDKHAAIGRGGHVAYATLSPNTVLNEALLADWASPKPRLEIRCNKEQIKGNEGIADLNWHIYLRDTAGHVAQALGYRIDQNVYPNPRNSAASIAFNHDQLDRTNNSFTMHAALGYGGDLNLRDHLGGAVFLTADRIDNASPAHVKENATDLGVGGSVAWFHHADHIASRVNLSVRADTDDHFAASLFFFDAQASFWPMDNFCVSKPLQLLRYLQLKCSWNVELEYAHVFNKGDFVNIQDKEYARGGGDVGVTLSLTDLPDAYFGDSAFPFQTLYGLLNKFSASAGYKVLEDLSRTGASLSRFTASINYKLGGDDEDGGLGRSAELSLSFVNGRADRTFQPERAWELQLKTAL